jgi:tyrosyl-tRNA synthetase
LVHGKGETDAAERAAAALFSGELAGLDEVTLLDVLSDAPSARIGREQVVTSKLGILDALVQAGLARSRSDARRTLLQGGVYVNNRRQEDPERFLGPADLIHDRYVVLRKGKKEQCLVQVGD